MEGSTGAPPQRVCPSCARISWATGPRCPYCTARFTRSGGVTPWMLALTGAIVLLGVGVMLVIGGRIIEDRTDDRIAEITKDFDASLDRFRDDVKKELDARAGSLGATTGIPTPTVPPAPTPSPESDSTPAPTATATPSAAASPTATATTEITP